MKKIFTIVLSLIWLSNYSQLTTIYSENFGGAGNTNFPGAWTSASGDWLIDPNVNNGGGVPECNVALTSSNSVMAGADGAAGLEESESAPFSTIGYSSITVSWNGFRTTGAPTMSLSYNINGGTYSLVPFTDVVADDLWHALVSFTLPVGAESQTNVRLKWSYNSSGNGFFMAFDDIIVQGVSSPIFYWNGVGALDLLTSWGTFTNGTGLAPTSFTANNQVFNMVNNPVATLAAPWTVSGTGSTLSIGNGTSGINFTIPSGNALTIGAGARLEVKNNSTITIQNTTFPAVASVSLYTGSTVDYAQSSTVTVWNTPHYNLTISGGANKGQSGSLIINNIFNLNGANYIMSNGSLINLTLNGTVVGTGSLLTGGTRLTINGSGNFGTLNFGPGATALTINRLDLNRAALGLVTLASNLTITGTTSLTAGVLDLNGNHLTMNGVITFPAGAGTGVIRGGLTSSLTIGGAGAINNNIVFDQTSATTRSFRDVTLNRASSTLGIGNPLEILGSITPNTGTISGGANVTIKNSATVKGRIGPIGASADFQGNPTVEAFYPGGTTGWANLCSPGLAGQTMANWNTVIPIVCSGCTYTDVGGVAFESVYSYDETLGAGSASNSLHYVPITSLGNAINPTAGYWVYVGDGETTTSDITVPMSGAINKKNSFGGMSLSLTGGVSSENGWNLIANPYPSPISLNSMFAGNTGNIDNTIQIWNADLNGGSGDWAFHVLGGATDAVPIGQGIMVRALVNPVSLTGSESWKTISMVSAQRTANNDYDYNDLFKLNLTGGGSKNFNTNTYFNFQSSFVSGFDNGRDVYAIDNASGNQVAQIFSKVNSDKYAVGAFPLPPVNGSSIIPIHVPTGYSGNYTITPMNIAKMEGLCVQLIDLSNNHVHDLLNGAYVANIASNNGTSPVFNLKVTDCGAAVSQPLSINNSNAVSNSIKISNDENGVFVKFDLDQSTNATISVTNILGQKIVEDKAVHTSKETVYLDQLEKNQLIFVTVTTETEKITKKIIR